MELLKLSQFDLEALVDTSLIDNPFSEADNSVQDITEYKEIDYGIVRKNNDELLEFEIPDDNKNDLIEHVMPQLDSHIKSQNDEQIFMILLESLNSKGYLSTSIEDLRKILSVNEETLIDYLHALQHVDPLGLGSRDLKECLLIQLNELEDVDFEKVIVEKYLEQLSRGDFLKIAKKENKSLDDVKNALVRIQQLNPIPANGFKVNEKTVYIIPDVMVSVNENELDIQFNSNLDYKLKLNQQNYDLYKSASLDVQSKEFLKEKLNNFNYLKYSIYRRNMTIKKIFLFLAEYQKNFLLTGDERRLKPIRLNDIAQVIGINESTVSRAISNKYFRCDYGTYSFRFLIPKSYARNGEVTASINTIKNEIKEIIRYEDKSSPFSDQEIQMLLEEEGFNVSRRSVSLYRKELHIPSSRNRKEITK